MVNHPGRVVWCYGANGSLVNDSPMTRGWDHTTRACRRMEMLEQGNVVLVLDDLMQEAKSSSRGFGHIHQVQSSQQYHVHCAGAEPIPQGQRDAQHQYQRQLPRPDEEHPRPRADPSPGAAGVPRQWQVPRRLPTKTRPSEPYQLPVHGLQEHHAGCCVV